VLRGEVTKLVARLDAFGDGPQIECLGQDDDGVDDGNTALPMLKSGKPYLM